MTSSNSKDKHIETGIGPMTDNMLNVLIKKMNESGLKDSIECNIFEPTLEKIKNRFRPYLLLTVVLYLIIIVLLWYIIRLLKKK